MSCLLNDPSISFSLFSLGTYLQCKSNLRFSSPSIKHSVNNEAGHKLFLSVSCSYYQADWSKDLNSKALLFFGIKEIKEALRLLQTSSAYIVAKHLSMFQHLCKII